MLICMMRKSAASGPRARESSARLFCLEPRFVRIVQAGLFGFVRIARTNPDKSNGRSTERLEERPERLGMGCANSAAMSESIAPKPFEMLFTMEYARERRFLSRTNLLRAALQFVVSLALTCACALWFWLPAVILAFVSLLLGVQLVLLARRILQIPKTGFVGVRLSVDEVGLKFFLRSGTQQLLWRHFGHYTNSEEGIILCTPGNTKSLIQSASMSRQDQVALEAWVRWELPQERVNLGADNTSGTGRKVFRYAVYGWFLILILSFTFFGDELRDTGPGLRPTVVELVARELSLDGQTESEDVQADMNTVESSGAAAR